MVCGMKPFSNGIPYGVTGDRGTMNHPHWEFDSICPKCGHVTRVCSPVGELVVRVHCNHCEHGYEYTHVIREYEEVEEVLRQHDS
ncbi:hypothetical protein AAC03nite_14060 [Alicyclobacillus acidoterrestris]|nr:hypothetical protein AAC03nite_14060 [Alicyclobacillus acidoterrestris]